MALMRTLHLEDAADNSTIRRQITCRL